MKTKYFIGSIFIGLILAGSIGLIGGIFVKATTGTENLQYPIKELGNCGSNAACKSYCDKSENVGACLNFAENKNLMSKEEIDLAKKFMAAGGSGPGDCRGKDECETYCNDIAHIDECVNFAENNNLMPAKDLEEAKKIQAAIKRGVKPPSCKNKEACDAYCDNSDHMEECVAFGIEAGFIQGKELEDAQKMLAALKRGVKPLPCRGKDACDAYCGNSNNMEVCMNFAMEAGLMNEQEKADSQKMLEAFKKGVKPPNCRGKDECAVYCSQEEHFNECTNFAEAAGFMTSEEAAMARKTGGKGPGNCKSKEECNAFCNNPDNQETCFNFAKENGMIPEADLKQMEDGKQKFKESLEQAPPAVIECLNSQIGADLMEKFRSGAVMPPKDMGDKMRVCFEKSSGPGGPNGQGEPGAGGAIPPAGQTGPGGCKSPEECKAYCVSHTDECKNFGPGGGQPAPGTGPPNSSGGQMIPGGPNSSGGQPGGPGGCQNPEGCQQPQNSSVPPAICQGGNCPPPPLPSQPGGPPSYPNGSAPSSPQPQIPPGSSQPPAGNIAPPAPSPPPPAGTPPPASSSIKSKSFLASLLDAFLSIFSR